MEVREGYTHWGEKVSVRDDDVLVVDCIFVAPVCSLWGDSMTIPPLPPAPSFHYVCLSGSAPRSAPPPVRPSVPRSGLVPVYVRRQVQKGHSVRNDTLLGKGGRSVEMKDVSKATGQGSHWWVYVLIFLFVDIIGLFVYFICRIDRK